MSCGERTQEAIEPAPRLRCSDPPYTRRVYDSAFIIPNYLHPPLSLQHLGLCPICWLVEDGRERAASQRCRISVLLYLLISFLRIKRSIVCAEAFYPLPAPTLLLGLLGSGSGGGAGGWYPGCRQRSPTFPPWVLF